MSAGEIAFLVLILGATGIFAVTLAHYSRG
jgi:hypothetical protein